MKRFACSFALMILAGSCLAAEVQMPQTAIDMGCPNCHAIDRKVVGPAWMEVSRRYRPMRNDQATFDDLVRKVSKGGSGHWGDVPMVANDPAGKRHDKIVDLVKFVLALSDPLPEHQAKQAR